MIIHDINSIVCLSLFSINFYCLKMIKREIKQEPGLARPKIDLRALVEKRQQQLGKIEKKVKNHSIMAIIRHLKTGPRS